MRCAVYAQVGVAIFQERILMAASIGNGWYVEYNQKPIPDRRNDYDFWHEDYDLDSGLCGTAESVEDAIRQIEEIST